MSITRESLWAALPSTSKGVPLHISYDPRSDRLVYPSNKSIHLRSLSNPSSSTQFAGHIAATSVAKFSPSGYYIASGDISGTVKVFDSSSTTEDPEIVKSNFAIISGRINDLAWDSDSKRIIAVGDGKERYGHCFTFDSGNSVGEIAGHSAQINAVDIRSVRPFRAATVADDSAMVWLTGPPFRFAKSVRGEHTNFATDVKFAVDGAYVISVGMDRKIVVYDGREGDVLAKVDGAHAGGILCVAAGKKEDGTPVFATASTDGRVKLWTYKDTGIEELYTWDVVTGEHLVGVTFTSSTKLVAVSLSGDLYYLSAGETTPTQTIYGHQKAITSLKVASDGKTLYTGSYDGRLVQWDIATGNSTVIAGSGHRNLVTSIVEAGGIIYTAGWDDTVKAVRGTEFSSLSLSAPSQPKGVAVAGKYLVLATEDAVYTHTTELISVSTYKRNSITSVCASDSFVAIGAQDGSVTLLTVPDLKTVSTNIPPSRASVSALAFSPRIDDQGRQLLAVGDSTGKIAVVNATDGSIVTTRWAFHTARVTSIEWRADGKYAVTGGLDTNIFVYSVDKPAKNVKTLGAHKDGVNGVAWAGDDKIVSIGADACVKWWNVSL
ncbi:quinon protein alcohol dehydrogenase-like superfamily [Lipomyces doorenjongii]|uniref:quinon protein alcohol dehydrogenase-like superfamily n=1 Tax=Lipomyces doorenjongii TaxID=383834 RepID=UPI0034CD5942